MTGTGVVVDGAGFALRVIGTHSARGAVLVTRDNFAVDSIKNIFFVKYYVLASITLLYFDHAITLPLEVRRIWCARFTGATFLFFLNRYVPFVGYIPVIISMFNPPWSIDVDVFSSSEMSLNLQRTSKLTPVAQRCRRFAPFVGIIGLICNIIAAVILILRTYALYNRAVWVLFVTGTFGATSVAVGAWSVHSVEGELFSFRPIVVCVPMLIHDKSLKFAWIMTFCFDFVVFVLTIARTYRFMRDQSRMHIESRLTVLLMRDGSIYFLVMSIFNAVNYILAVRLQNSFFASSTGTNSVLANVMSVTMISRLLLNLREEAVEYNRRTASGRDVPTVQTLTDTNLIFTSRILGNLTADFDHDEDSRRGRTRDTSENYYSYDFSGEESDEVYELQSRSTRTGFSSRSGYTFRTLSNDPGSSSGTGTFAGSSGSGSGSGSGTNSDKGIGSRKGKSKLAWTASVNTSLSSATGRHPRGEPQTPVVTAEGGRSQLFLPGDRSPQLLSPLSPHTTFVNSPIVRASPQSPHSMYPASPSDHGEPERREEEVGADVGSDRDNSNLRRQARPAEPGSEDAIELTNLEYRPRGESGREHHLFPDHYRRPPHPTPET